MISFGLYFNIFLPILLLFTNCNGQAKQDEQTLNTQNGDRVGGPCETCEMIYVGMSETINATDTSAGWQLPGPKLIVTGTVYKADKKTPAPDIILYYWQTDNKGIYADKEGLDPKARRHGYIRGWVKTDKNGKYTIYTNRPASYPNSNAPAHIHILVKEPTLKNEYYIDDIMFSDDPLLPKGTRDASEVKGGSGVVKVTKQNGVQQATRDIILGSNIESYPRQK
ncbi:intradiol ring-cleavage dioxygenase [Pontibacter sp. KCTC 32443]|uniref:dioxygenase family protein n=1 Tax=Pontibacter TaxID=323449 RepID=UPI00164E04B6|nr:MULTISPECIES: intradiol ring-cleavage dioxygenase [Pontibacter]MBC5775604.1 intradiol ring-cleavage dioxygenase [Pontibacter sp. KCTC 32443]